MQVDRQEDIFHFDIPSDKDYICMISAEWKEENYYGTGIFAFWVRTSDIAFEGLGIILRPGETTEWTEKPEYVYPLPLEAGIYRIKVSVFPGDAYKQKETLTAEFAVE